MLLLRSAVLLVFLGGCIVQATVMKTKLDVPTRSQLLICVYFIMAMTALILEVFTEGAPWIPMLVMTVTDPLFGVELADVEAYDDESQGGGKLYEDRELRGRIASGPTG
jgi:hypothetical protein